jgi:signal transduction histidine kinase/phage shock protein PspC (stress-responsive transcriptional regulator)
MATQTYRRIYRSDRDRMIAGVAAGFGDYLGVDAALVRVAFVALAFVGGLGVVAYVACWVLVPTPPPGVVVERAPARRIDTTRVLIGAGGVLVLLLLVRALDLWLGDSFVWPVLLVAGGLALLWTRASDERRADLSRSVREFGGSGRGTVLRLVLGAGLLVAGVSTFVAASDAAAAAARGLAAAAVVVAGLVLIFAPWWRRLVRELAEERRERIRSQERAELAAHLHDSVLQTLTLIQRRSRDPDEVVQLARRQERELRAWLYGREGAAAARSLAESLRSAAEEIEDRHGVTVEVVCVGDRELDEPVEALVAAAREAMANAASHSGEERVDVYLEVTDERAAVFVRDRGAGFDPATVPADRKGLSESIDGRMTRAGGSAGIHSTPGEGTEVELELPLSRTTASSAEPAT